MRYIIFGQAGFLICLLICVLILPQGLAANDGYSYYGVHTQTILPFSLGLLLMDWFYFKAATSLDSSPIAQVIKYGVYAILVLMVVGLITPFKHNSIFHWWHVAATISIVVLVLGLSSFQVVTVRWDLVNIVLLILMTMAILITALSLHPANGFLIQGEVAFNLLFAIIWARSASLISTDYTQPKLSTVALTGQRAAS